MQPVLQYSISTHVPCRVACRVVLVGAPDALARKSHRSRIGRRCGRPGGRCVGRSALRRGLASPALQTHPIPLAPSNCSMRLGSGVPSAAKGRPSASPKNRPSAARGRPSPRCDLICDPSAARGRPSPRNGIRHPHAPSHRPQRPNPRPCPHTCPCPMTAPMPMPMDQQRGESARQAPA